MNNTCVVWRHIGNCKKYIIHMHHVQEKLTVAMKLWTNLPQRVSDDLFHDRTLNTYSSYICDSCFKLFGTNWKITWNGAKTISLRLPIMQIQSTMGPISFGAESPLSLGNHVFHSTPIKRQKMDEEEMDFKAIEVRRPIWSCIRAINGQIMTMIALFVCNFVSQVALTTSPPMVPF